MFNKKIKNIIKVELCVPLKELFPSDRSLSEQLKVVKALGIKEYRKIEKELYNDKDGWQLLHAYLLKNICPKCGCALYIFHQSSPAWTWSRLCGLEGYRLYCPNCKQEIGFILTRMN